ncbi:hypothetical protein SteCoe_29166 [Stentor coeruleus]|uniref:Uncharacterized protein n=1 Tax=Stentor coeruleus TaxID=5963 RepID=A0A1R2B6H6_9CILI|nr:hypothetical protein SteCoe_29166 [Stentor coeruleus]
MKEETSEDEKNEIALLDRFYDLKTYENKKILYFFKNRNYRVLNSYQEVNESDFIETMMSFENYYRKQGSILGICIMGIGWDTLFRRMVPISKIALGFVLIKGLGNYSVHRNLSTLSSPLTYVFDKYYKPKLK